MEVWQKQQVDDTFGGFTVAETKLSDSWADIKSVPMNKYTEYGLDTSNQSIRVKLRWRNDVDYMEEGIFFKYRSKSWTPIRLYDLDLDRDEIIVIATMVK